MTPLLGRRSVQITANLHGKQYTAKETNGRFFCWSPRALRWLPIAKAKVSFS